LKVNKPKIMNIIGQIFFKKVTYNIKSHLKSKKKLLKELSKK